MEGAGSATTPVRSRIEYKPRIIEGLYDPRGSGGIEQKQILYITMEGFQKLYITMEGEKNFT